MGTLSEIVKQFFHNYDIVGKALQTHVFRPIIKGVKMAENAVVPSEKKSFREAFFAEAERKDPNKKTIWEAIVIPAVIIGGLFALAMLGVAIVSLVDWAANGQGEAHAAATVAGTALQSLLT